jgi:hypothetical protein
VKRFADYVGSCYQKLEEPIKADPKLYKYIELIIVYGVPDLSEILGHPEFM